MTRVSRIGFGWTPIGGLAMGLVLFVLLGCSDNPSENSEVGVGETDGSRIEDTSGVGDVTDAEEMDSDDVTPADAPEGADGDAVDTAARDVADAGGMDSGGRDTADGRDGDGGQSSVMVTSVTAGAAHSCALSQQGEVFCWGRGAYGQLGNGRDDEDYVEATPVPVQDLDAARAVSAGGRFTCALTQGGEVYCWGAGTDGQLGTGGQGRDSNTATPVRVQGISTAEAISAGGRHTCTILESGEIRCWGHGTYGELGDGSKTSSPTPVAVQGIDSAVSVSAGFDHTCAALEAGEVRCWGNGIDGQLGDGSTSSSATPVAVERLTSAASVSVANEHVGHSCAVLKSGEIYCWGEGEGGRLGTGKDYEDYGAVSPVKVKDLDTAVAVAAGGEHSCGRLEAGTIYCWGRGYLGHGGTLNSTTPRDVRDITTAVDLSAGDEHTCAVVQAGDVYCWGDVEGGRLGNGQTGPEDIVKARPVEVKF